MRDELIKLVSITASGSELKEHEIEIYADKKSVVRSEFYSAVQVGLKVKYIFEVDSDDFEMCTRESGAEPARIIHNGVNYNILRSYERTKGIMEITVG